MVVMFILAEMIVFLWSGFAAKENKWAALRSGLKYISVHCYSLTSYTVPPDFLFPSGTISMRAVVDVLPTLSAAVLPAPCLQEQPGN